MDDLNSLFDGMTTSLKEVASIDFSPESKIGMMVWSDFELYTKSRWSMMKGVFTGTLNGYQPWHMFPLSFVQVWTKYPIQIIANYATMPYKVIKFAKQFAPQKGWRWVALMSVKKIAQHPISLFH